MFKLYWLSSFASIKCFIFHHFSQKTLKRLYDYAFDVLLVIFEIQECLTSCHIIYQQHQLAHLECSSCVFRSNQRLKLVFATFLLSMQYSGVRTKTGFLRIRFISPSEATCLLDDCCFSELSLPRSN